MNKPIYILLAVLLVWALGACSTKHPGERDDRRVLMQDSTDSSGLLRMQTSRSEQTVKFGEKEYRSFILRSPSDSLPHVKSATGDNFLDNKITLKLTQGGKQVFHKTFTKQSFSSLISPEFLKNAILEGMVYDKTTSSGIVYAASVSYPQTDLYIPVSITISADGKMSMVKEEMMEEVYMNEDD